LSKATKQKRRAWQHGDRSNNVKYRPDCQSNGRSRTLPRGSTAMLYAGLNHDKIAWNAGVLCTQTFIKCRPKLGRDSWASHCSEDQVAMLTLRYALAFGKVHPHPDQRRYPGVIQPGIANLSSWLTSGTVGRTRGAARLCSHLSNTQSNECRCWCAGVLVYSWLLDPPVLD